MAPRTKSRKPRIDVCKEITDRMIALFEQGTVPWRKTWAPVGFPQNAKTGTLYRGMNVMSLMLTSMVKGYADPRWLTYKQAAGMGGQVRKGEKGTRVVFWKPIKRKVEKNGETKEKSSVFAKAYTVFNVEQVDGLELEPIVPPAQPIEAAEELIREYMDSGPDLQHGGDSAAYSPSKDTVFMPAPGSFESPAAYYRVLFHEVGHSTGHPSRLDRGLSASFGSHEYSEEELVAELTASMLCALCGVNSEAAEENSAAYLASWIERLKADPSMLKAAAGKAQKAVDFILAAEAAQKAA